MSSFASSADVRRTAGVAAVLGAAVALTAACGSQSGTGHAASPAAGAPKPVSSLTISITPAPGATPRRWTLTCGSVAGGTHPRPEAACAALAHAQHPFAPVQHGIMCAMIDSGTQTASVRGTWEGRPVATIYSRRDSCQTARWNKLWKVLGQVNPGGPMIPVFGRVPSG